MPSSELPPAARCPACAAPRATGIYRDTVPYTVRDTHVAEKGYNVWDAGWTSRLGEHLERCACSSHPLDLFVCSSSHSISASPSLWLSAPIAVPLDQHNMRGSSRPSSDPTYPPTQRPTFPATRPPQQPHTSQPPRRLPLWRCPPHPPPTTSVPCCLLMLSSHVGAVPSSRGRGGRGYAPHVAPASRASRAARACSSPAAL